MHTTIEREISLFKCSKKLSNKADCTGIEGAEILLYV